MDEGMTIPQILNKTEMFTKLTVVINLILITLFLGSSSVTASPSEPTASYSIFLPIIAKPGPIPFGSIHEGNGTWYYATGAGNCSFPASPENMMVAAMNHIDYANSALCGAYVQVTGPNDTIIVRIVDQCPECPVNHIDLSQEAFVEIANLADGRVSISWQLVSYPLPTPIVYHFKDGSNEDWTAVQIRNHSNPITKVEYQDSSSVFHAIPRLSYNYFVQSNGLGTGPYTFRITDHFGHTIVDSGIPHVENGDVIGSTQFPPP